MKNYLKKSKILLDQQVTAQTIIVKKCIKIRFDADGDVTVKRTLGLHSVIILFRSISKEGNKYYPQYVLDECLYELP